MKYESCDAKRVEYDLDGRDSPFERSAKLRDGEFFLVPVDIGGEEYTYLYPKVPGVPAGYRRWVLRRKGQPAPEGVTSWEWDGKEDAPTLIPSVRIWGGDGKGGKVVIWHGHLENGRFVGCDDKPE